MSSEPPKRVLYPDIPQLSRDSILSMSIEWVKEISIHSPDYVPQDEAMGGEDSDNEATKPSLEMKLLSNSA